MTVRRNIMSNKKIITLLMGLFFFNPYVFSSDNTNTENNQRSQKESRKKEIEKKYQDHTAGMMSRSLLNALKYDIHDLAVELIEAGAKVSPSMLIQASQQCKPEFVKTFLKEGVEVNKYTSKKSAAICYTIRKDCSSVTKILIAHGADINGKSCRFRKAKDRYNSYYVVENPLAYAFHSYPGSKKVIEVLMRAGAVDVE